MEKLQQAARANFDVHELLGLTYAAQAQDAKAEEQLRAAVRLSPGSVSTRNNLAASLVRVHKELDAEAEWRAALTAERRRYAALKPKDALAQYDYAISLWKGRRVNTPEVDYPAVQALLQRSIALDGTNAEVHLQLGILYNDRHEYEQAQAEFERAVHLDALLGDAHFRLGRAYLRAGNKDKAQLELDQFQRLQAQHQAALDKERAEVQQFVIATQSAAPATPASQATL